MSVEPGTWVGRAPAVGGAALPELLVVAILGAQELARAGRLTDRHRRAIDDALKGLDPAPRNGSVDGTKVDGEPVTAAAWITTAEASRRLGVTDRAVRKAIARGALVARQIGAGGPYVVDERSVARWMDKRRKAA